MTVVVQLAGLEVRGRHGAEPHEREAEQLFLYDLELELPPPRSDDLGATVDYRELVALVRELSDERQFHLLESLALALADRCLERFPAERVRVRVRKPEVQLGVPVEHAAAYVQRSR